MRRLSIYAILIIVLFALLLSSSLILIPKVKINDNKADYLPDKTESKIGLVILNEEFNLKSNAKVLVKNKSIEDILAVKEQIKQVEGVEKVIWLDDFVDLTQTPINFVPENILKNYYTDSKALFDITFTDDSESDLTKEAISDINSLLEDGGVGLNERNAYEIAYTVSLFAIAIILLIIILFTDSLFSGILILITLGTAIGINLGTNIIFKEISDITYIATAIIQLAVSIDYALVFFKNLKIARTKFAVINDAVNYANKQSVKTILASSLTTIAGFLALCVMNYRIGSELGIVLAKGVLLSLVCVLLLLPQLTKVSIKLIDKTKHRSLFPSLNWLSKLIHGKMGILMLVVLLGLLVFGYYGQSQNQFTYSDNQVEYTDIEEEIIDNFGHFNQMVLIVPKGNKQTELTLINEINKLDKVKSISGLYTLVSPETPEELIPAEYKAQFLSDNYSLIHIVMDLENESKETFDSIKKIRNLAGKYYDESYLTGQSPIISDIKTTVDRDYVLVIVISILAIALIIVLVFKSVVIPILLLLIIQSAIWINMAIPYYQGIELVFLGYILISSIQLGSTIDYAIIMTEHYEKERKEQRPVQAAKKAFIISWHSIIVSMLSLVVAGFSISLLMDMDLIRDLGQLIGRGTFISGVLSLIVLPQLLILFDKLITKTTYRRFKHYEH